MSFEAALRVGTGVFREVVAPRRAARGLGTTQEAGNLAWGSFVPFSYSNGDMKTIFWL